MQRFTPITRTIASARPAGTTGLQATAKGCFFPIPDDARLPPESTSQSEEDTFHARQQRRTIRSATCTTRPRVTDPSSTSVDVRQVYTKRESRPTIADLTDLSRKGTERLACPSVSKRPADFYPVREEHKEFTRPSRAAHFRSVPHKKNVQSLPRSVTDEAVDLSPASKVLNAKIQDTADLLRHLDHPGIGFGSAARTGALWEKARQKAKANRPPPEQTVDEVQRLDEMLQEALDQIDREVDEGKHHFDQRPSDETTDPELRAVGQQFQQVMDQVCKPRRALELRIRQRRPWADELDIKLEMDLHDLARRKDLEQWQIENEACGLWGYYRVAKIDIARAQGLPVKLLGLPRLKGAPPPAASAPPPVDKYAKPSRIIIRRDRVSSTHWRYPVGYTGPRPPVNVDLKPCYREEVAIPPQSEAVIDTCDNDDHDDAILISHIDWASRLEEGSRRRAERQKLELQRERDSPPASAEVPTFVGTVLQTAKTWLVNAWTAVKTTIWG